MTATQDYKPIALPHTAPLQISAKNDGLQNLTSSFIS